MRLIIAFILMLSISFACEQPYKEVQGIKIGCPIENMQGLTLIQEKDDINRVVYEKNMDGMFNTAILWVVNGNIEAVIFKRTKEFDPSLFDELLLRLDDQWHDQIMNRNAPVMPNLIVLEIQDNTIGRIILGQANDPQSYLILSYYSNKINNL